MAKACAYCGSQSRLTREHVWPGCFLEREGRAAAHFSVKAQKVHGADYVVSDVCAPCNSTRLSPLDAYFCRLYDEYFAEPRDFDSEVIFRFDFDLLARSLLKIGYNAARCAGTDPEPFLPTRRYILGLTERPALLTLFAELVSPSLLSRDEDPDEVQKVMPLLSRSAVTQVTTEAGRRVHTRIIAVRSFYFHLVLPFAETSDAEFEAGSVDLGRLIPGVVKLEPTGSEVVLRSSPQDGIRSFVPHIQAHRDQYAEYFNNEGKEQ